MKDSNSEASSLHVRETVEHGTLCPSSTCHEGALLIALLGEDGRLGYLRPPIPIDEQFIQAAERYGDPESRFRFAGSCVKDSCKHWGGGHCTLVGRLSEAMRRTGSKPSSGLPRCGIRNECRWFAQDGPRACEVCPIVVYRPSGSINRSARRSHDAEPELDTRPSTSSPT